MAVDFNASPKKQKMNRQVMESALQMFAEKRTFRITFTNNKDRSQDVIFRSYVTAIVAKGYIDDIKQNVLQNTDGFMTIDRPLLALMTHTFIIKNLSSMKIPVIPTNIESAEPEPDIMFISALGAYFCDVSPEYLQLFDSFLKLAEQACNDVIDQYKAISSAVANGLNAAELLDNPMIAEQLHSK